MNCKIKTSKNRLLPLVGTGGERKMDKLMDNPWFIKGVALVLAFLLFSSVPDGNNNSPTDENVPAQQDLNTLSDIPVKSYYDTDNFVVTGVPEKVEISIEGPKSIVQSTKSLKDFEVFVDLTDANIGKQKVKIQIKDISDKLKVTISPSQATVTVQEKVTKEFNVEAEFNRDLLEDGYNAETPQVKPNKVKITGAKEEIEKITYVKATVDLKGSIRETITKEASILVLDRELNKLNVSVEPKTVQVTIPIKTSSKTVPIEVIQKGTPAEGVIIDSITLDIPEAKIIGKDEVIKSTDKVRVEVDVSKINETSELTLPVIIPDGITKVTPEVVKATVKIQKEEQKTVSNVPIDPIGLETPFNIVFQSPIGGKMELSISGPSETLRLLTAADFKLVINVANLGLGDHDVPIQANGPGNVSWKLKNETAKISIQNKEA
jgi:YbbR domain-containing protein